MVKLTTKERIWIFVMILLAILVFKPTIPGIQSLEGLSTELQADIKLTEYVTLSMDERVDNAILTITPVTDVGEYSVDVGEIGIDYTTTGPSEVDVKKEINRYMGYCSVETCNVPITIISEFSGNITLNLDLNITTIEITSAEQQITRAQLSKRLPINLLLLFAVIIVGSYLLLLRYNPNLLRRIRKKL